MAPALQAGWVACWVAAASLELAGRRSGPGRWSSSRRRAVGLAVRGGGRDREPSPSSYFGGSGLEEKWYSELGAGCRESAASVREETAVEAAEHPSPLEALSLLDAATLRAAAWAAGLVATLVGAIWLRSRRSSRAGGAEKAYADSVAALEAQLHRLSVDRQMLADEFAEARKSLENQIASVTATAESSRSEMASALDRAERDAANTRAELSAISARLDAELKTSEQLRQDKARQQIELDALQAAVAARRRAALIVDNQPDGDEDDYRPPRARQRRSEARSKPAPTTKKTKTTGRKKKAATKPTRTNADLVCSLSSPTRAYPSIRPTPQVADLRRQLELTRNKIAKNGGDP